MEGYTKLSDLMGAHPNVAIFRTFATLNTQNLLYLQAELMHLEKGLRDTAIHDRESGDPQRILYEKYWLKLKKSTENGGDPLQWNKFLEIRGKLKEYNKALLQYTQLTALAAPTNQSLRLLREWLKRPAYGGSFLQGVESRTWDLESGYTDYIAFDESNSAQDTLTRWIFGPILNMYHRLLGHRLMKAEPGDDVIFEYQSKRLQAVADAISTVLASLFPTLSIFVLYFVKMMLVRLGLVLIFTTCFTLILVLVSKARRVEIFAATAGFAAVQVVFVGSTRSTL